MTGIPFLDVFFIVAAILVVVLASCAEAAVRAVSRARLEALGEAGNGAAARCLKLKTDGDRLHGGVFLLQIIVLIVVLALAAPYFAGVCAMITAGIAQSALAVLVCACVGALALPVAAVAASVLPILVARGIGTAHAETVALRMCGFLAFIHGAMRVPIGVTTRCGDMLLRPFHARVQYSESIVSEEGLLDMLEEGTKTGILDATEQELIESIFEFTETTASEIMVPRKDVVAIDASLTPEAILEHIIEEGFTRMPVYENSLDNILGIVYAKDVVSLIQHKNLILLHDILRTPFFVPETKPISELLREFQRKKIHLAVVVDEFGGTEGIITMEDILEEIVGDIQDEYDEDAKPYIVLGDGAVEVDGGLNITDFNEYTGFTLPESDRYDTIGGFIATLTGRIPEEGDKCAFQSIDIDVLKVDERRVKLARFTQRTPEPEA